MRVCFISRRFFPAVSGMSVYAANLLRELVALGHDVTMVSQYRGDERGSRIYGGGPPPAAPGVDVIGLEALGEQDGGDFERDVDVMVDTIVRLHARAPFDILHAQYGYPTGWATILAARRLGVPSVVSIQGGDGHWVGSCCATHHTAMRAVIDHAGAVLIGGPSFVDEVATRLDVSPARFTIVPGAVDTSVFHPGALRQAQAPFHFLYHGRVDRRKGVLDFIEAAALMKARGLVFSCTISGIGPDLEAARALMAERSLQDVVACTGYAAYAEAPEFYRRADAFASPTYAEGFSNTVLEAMASRVPIVSCRVTGVVDCLRDDIALLTEPGDIAALAQAMTRLLEDAALRERLAGAALAECRARYAWPVVAREISSIYDRLRGTRPDADFEPHIPVTPCRFRAEPHLL